MTPLMIVKWLIVAAVVVAVLWWARRKRRALSGHGAGSFLPSPTPPASRTARIVEAIVLSASAAIIIAIAATSRSTGGLMLMLDELRPQYAIANVVMFLCAVVGAAIAVFITLRGRAVGGVFTMAVVLIGYGLVLNGGSYPGSWFLPKQMVEPINEYAINIGGTNIEDAELWVNGVYLGKTPYTTTLDEFEAKVPYWPQPPADYETDKVEVPEYKSSHSYTQAKSRWIKFGLPSRPSRPGSGASTRPWEEQKNYYARVRYAGEWGLGGGGSGSGGSGGGVVFRANSYFDVIFPERQKRLDVLLTMARLADYRAGAEWFQAIETYNEDGWIALRKAADDEPRMMEVLDAWAAWHYGLDKVTDADSAWQAFTRICDEADAQQQYLTSSVAGRAVELLVPKLPQDRLLGKATCLIRNTGTIGYFKWRMNGRLQFGYSLRPGGVNLGSSGEVFSGFTGGQNGALQLSMSGFAVAHAVWMLYQSDPNVIKSRIAPQIVCWHYQTGLIDPLLAAAYFGGPVVDRFLLRQNWQAEPRQLRPEEWVYLSGRETNRWLYMLAYLNDEAGREFRRQHADTVMDLADKFYEDRAGSWGMDIDFIFMDPWLAKEYWPRFARLARQKSPQYALTMQWQYLLRMGDAAMPGMFVDAWAETNIDGYGLDRVFGLLDQLKPDTQAEVVRQLVQHVQEHSENLDRVLKQFDSTDKVIAELKAHARGNKRQQEAAVRLADLQRDNPTDRERLQKSIPLWLAHTQPNSPLVEMLARSDDPARRLMVMGALRECPTPQNRQLLEQLLQDPDPTVQAAAKDVMAHLKALAAESPSRYISNAPSAATEPSTAATRGETK